ncbi:MAG: glycerophosphodiester phosphodiesterase [Butyrivibrio sp.]|nr:glycerophosphodiester phosphodiesterase [Butyrivibrio sp.]
MLFLKVLVVILVILIVLYFFAIQPRIIKKPSRKEHIGVLYAHRGLFDNNSDAPENSMLAFQKAVNAGYGIELDIQLSKDGIPVIFHDFTLARVARYPKGEEPEDAVRNEDGSLGVKGKVEDYTFEELQRFHLFNSEEKIPTFESFLKMVDGKVPLIVELKIEKFDLSLCPKADALLREYKGVYCIESFNPLGIRWYKQNHNEIMRGQLSDWFFRDDPNLYRGLLYFMLTNLFFNFYTRPDFVAYNHKFFMNPSRCICHVFYRNLAAAWTIKSQEELEKARKHFDIYIFDSFIPKDGPVVQ